MPLTDYKMLLLNVNRTGWHSGNMIYDMQVLDKACNVVNYGPGWNNYEHTDIDKIISQVYGDNLPDIIYSYFTPNQLVSDVYNSHYRIPESLWRFPTNMHALTQGRYKDIKRAFAVSDFWARSPGKWIEDMKGSNFQYCFSCFTPPLSKDEHFYQFINPSIMGNPVFVCLARCVDKDCFKDYGMKKQQDIITLGSMCNFYKFRRSMHGMLARHTLSSDIRYKNYPHCGTNFHHSGFVREEYAKAINQSLSLASCGGRYHLYFNKIFESWGCNTAYIGEKPYGAEFLHMEDGFNYIAVTQENFMDKVGYYMEHKDELSEIAHNGRETFLKYHHLDARAQDAANLLDQVMEG